RTVRGGADRSGPRIARFPGAVPRPSAHRERDRACSRGCRSCLGSCELSARKPCCGLLLRCALEVESLLPDIALGGGARKPFTIIGAAFRLGSPETRIFCRRTAFGDRLWKKAGQHRFAPAKAWDTSSRSPKPQNCPGF